MRKDVEKQMSIHGHCFDTGMSGRCGQECEVFQGIYVEDMDECPERITVLSNIDHDLAIEANNEEYVSDEELFNDGRFDEYLMIKFFGELIAQVINQQTIKIVNIRELIKNKIEND